MFVFGLVICLFHADEEAALEIEEGIEIQEDVMDCIAGDDALLLDRLFELLQHFKVLDIRPFGLYELVYDMLAVSAFRCRRSAVGFVGLWQIRVQDAFLHKDVENTVDNTSDLRLRISGSSNDMLRETHLYEAGGVIAVEVGDDEQLVGREFELVDAGVEELEGRGLTTLLLVEIELGLVNC